MIFKKITKKVSEGVKRFSTPLSYFKNQITKIDERIYYKIRMLYLLEKNIALDKSINGMIEEVSRQGLECIGLQMRYFRIEDNLKFYVTNAELSGIDKDEMIEKIDKLSGLFKVGLGGIQKGLFGIGDELDEIGIINMVKKTFDNTTKPTDLDMAELEKAEVELYKIEEKIEEFKTNVLD
ncbi:MAG: hypothetical protein ABIH83_00875, partial [Candidatus Micrarchaeota archaeon]